MKSALRPMFAVNPMPATQSGVRVSCRPRSRPVAANTTSIAGRPAIEIERYTDASAETAADAPKSPTSHGVAAHPATASTAPRASASQSPSTPAATPARSSPAPRRRATAGVVA